MVNGNNSTALLANATIRGGKFTTSELLSLDTIGGVDIHNLLVATKLPSQISGSGRVFNDNAGDRGLLAKDTDQLWAKFGNDYIQVSLNNTGTDSKLNIAAAVAAASVADIKKQILPDVANATMGGSNANQLAILSNYATDPSQPLFSNSKTITQFGARTDFGIYTADSASAVGEKIAFVSAAGANGEWQLPATTAALDTRFQAISNRVDAVAANNGETFTTAVSGNASLSAEFVAIATEGTSTETPVANSNLTYTTTTTNGGASNNGAGAEFKVTINGSSVATAIEVTQRASTPYVVGNDLVLTSPAGDTVTLAAINADMVTLINTAANTSATFVVAINSSNAITGIQLKAKSTADYLVGDKLTITSPSGSGSKTITMSALTAADVLNISTDNSKVPDQWKVAENTGSDAAETLTMPTTLSVDVGNKKFYMADDMIDYSPAHVRARGAEYRTNASVTQAGIIAGAKFISVSKAQPSAIGELSGDELGKSLALFTLYNSTTYKWANMTGFGLSATQLIDAGLNDLLADFLENDTVSAVQYAGASLTAVILNEIAGILPLSTAAYNTYQFDMTQAAHQHAFKIARLYQFLRANGKNPTPDEFKQLVATNANANAEWRLINNNTVSGYSADVAPIAGGDFAKRLASGADASNVFSGGFSAGGINTHITTRGNAYVTQANLTSFADSLTTTQKSEYYNQLRNAALTIGSGSSLFETLAPYQNGGSNSILSATNLFPSPDYDSRGNVLAPASQVSNLFCALVKEMRRIQPLQQLLLDSDFVKEASRLGVIKFGSANVNATFDASTANCGLFLGCEDLADTDADSNAATTAGHKNVFKLIQGTNTKKAAEIVAVVENLKKHASGVPNDSTMAMIMDDNFKVNVTALAAVDMIDLGNTFTDQELRKTYAVQAPVQGSAGRGRKQSVLTHGLPLFYASILARYNASGVLPAEKALARTNVDILTFELPQLVQNDDLITGAARGAPQLSADDAAGLVEYLHSQFMPALAATGADEAGTVAGAAAVAKAVILNVPGSGDKLNAISVHPGKEQQYNDMIVAMLAPSGNASGRRGNVVVPTANAAPTSMAGYNLVTAEHSAYVNEITAKMNGLLSNPTFDILRFHNTFNTVGTVGTPTNRALALGVISTFIAGLNGDKEIGIPEALLLKNGGAFIDLEYKYITYAFYGVEGDGFSIETKPRRKYFISRNNLGAIV